MADQSAQYDTPLDEQLVAYLDGELDASAARQVEAMLARDAGVRQRLDGLQQAWDMLGSLETAEADAKFAETTLEMVAAAAAEELVQNQQAAPERQRRQWLRLLLAAVFVALSTFVLTAWFAPDPNRDLLKHLPLIEKFDQYRKVGNVEFLRGLHEQGIMNEGEENAKE